MRTSSKTRLGVVTIANGLLWATVATYSLHAGMPHNPIHLPYEKTVDATSWAPQGWAFFTRSPRDEEYTTFVRAGSSWQPRAKGTNSSASNWFGLSRRARALANETGSILFSVAETQWTSCAPGLTVEACLESAPVAATIANPLPEPSLCGAVGLTAQKPVPWAWANASPPVQMPFRIVRLEVTC
jgi:antimicrobial peptide system SdpA family protein